VGLAWLLFVALSPPPTEATRLLQRRGTPLAALPAAPPPFPDPLEACFEVPRSICLREDAVAGAEGEGAGRSFIVGPAPALSDLVLWYQFDKSLPVDESGHWRHLTDSQGNLSPLTVGPGLLGRGGSASFDGRGYRTVAPSEAFDSPAFTVALWVYLREDSVGSWRTIFSRGSSPGQLMPALLLWPDQRRLHVRASLRADLHDGSLDSSGLLPLRRWTHLAVACTGSVLRLYVNGVKDGETILEEPLPTGGGGGGGQSSLYVGRDPWRAGTKAYLDDFRWYSRALPPDEIRALVFPSLTGAAADFVHLGCSSCAFTEAVRSCGSRSHLCSLQELYAGGFHVARVMGWLAASPSVWYRNEEGEDLFSGEHRLGLCCEV